MSNLHLIHTGSYPGTLPPVSCDAPVAMHCASTADFRDIVSPSCSAPLLPPLPGFPIFCPDRGWEGGVCMCTCGYTVTPPTSCILCDNLLNQSNRCTVTGEAELEGAYSITGDDL